MIEIMEIIVGALFGVVLGIPVSILPLIAMHNREQGQTEPERWLQPVSMRFHLVEPHLLASGEDD